MTLPRLVLAWLAVAGWFVIATFGTDRLLARFAREPGGAEGPRPARPLMLKWRLGEAALVTLLASLWFDSLGSGGWALVFLLLGALATIPPWLLVRPATRALGLATLGAELARYLGAGAILAWRLG